VRNALDLPAAREVVAAGPLRELARAALGPGAFATRAILFDKTPEANWPVPWHQDLSVAVRGRADVPGWGPWSDKAGVPHVQPPAAVLERMATTRLHLDDCGPENGPLLVLPGTHRRGRLSARNTEDQLARQPPAACLASAGDVLLLRPLLLHASGKATRPGHRRVLHVEWATENLPPGLEWWEQV
jgi:ectoine hydroxylase-related dioxygenase (phytanoyl-CoA dioxygenase family)